MTGRIHIDFELNKSCTIRILNKMILTKYRRSAVVVAYWFCEVHFMATQHSRLLRRNRHHGQPHVLPHTSEGRDHLLKCPVGESANVFDGNYIHLLSHISIIGLQLSRTYHSSDETYRCCRISKMTNNFIYFIYLWLLGF